MFRLGWNNLRRDLRASDIWMIAGAVVLAVASFTAVGFFSDRLSKGLQRDAAQLLGGDTVVVSDNPLPSSFLEQAKIQALQATQTAVFPSMARSANDGQGQIRLVSLKAVEAKYPLRGKLLLSRNLTALPTSVQGPPAPGTVWVDPSLLDALGLTLGDRLYLGDSGFTIAQLIVNEPDRGGGFVNFAPRVMINWADLPATGLIQPASRITYRLAVATPDASSTSQQGLTQFGAWVQAVLADPKQTKTSGIRLESLEVGRPEMTQTLKRAGSFLGFVTLLATLMAAVALAIAARNFASHHLNTCAMFRVFGLSQRAIVLLYGVELLLLAVIASVIGVGIGCGVQMALVALVSNVLAIALPPPTWYPIGLGIGVGVILVLSFGLAPVLQLSRVSPLRVLRRDLGSPKASTITSIVMGTVGITALLLLVSDNVVLSVIVLFGFLGAGLVFAAIAYVAVQGLKRLVGLPWLPSWARIANRQLTARPGVTSLQIVSLSFGLLAMLLLVLLRTDLVQEWRQSSSAQAPDRFVINVLPDQAPAFQSALKAGQAKLLDWYPMMRGRLIQINGVAVNPDQFSDERAKRLVDREFNLSSSQYLPAHNQLTAGTWQGQETGAISMEEGIATTLHIQLGDRLVFDIGGMTSEVKVTSLRKVNWSSMRANFFAMYPVDHLPDIPQTLMGTFKVPAGSVLDSRLVNQFPNITIVDVRQTIEQVQKVLNQVVLAVELLFGFSVAAGIFIVATSLSGTRADRLHELSVMRALGASRRLLIKVQRTELALLGLLSGGMASVAANAMAWALSHYVFDFSWSFSWTSVALGLGGGVVLALTAGTLALRGIATRPVMQSLRQVI